MYICQDAGLFSHDYLVLRFLSRCVLLNVYIVGQIERNDLRLVIWIRICRIRDLSSNVPLQKVVFHPLQRNIYSPTPNPANPVILKILVQTTDNWQLNQKTENYHKHTWKILFQFPQTFPSHSDTCYNPTTMKNKNCTQPITSTKTDTRYLKNIHSKTDHNKANQNVPNRKFQKVSYTLINPIPDRRNPQKQNVHRNEKRPFCVRF